MINFFGTDGIRTTMGQPPFTPEHLMLLGKAIGMWAQEKYGKKPTIALGSDTRISSSLVKSALQTGLTMHPITLYDAMIIPTPALYKVIQARKKIDCGIMLSASHNPYHDNGIKLFDRVTGKLSEMDEKRISEIFNAYNHKEFVSSTEAIDYTNLGTIKIWNTAQKLYSTLVKKYFKKNFLQGMTIVLDCANGATYRVAFKIFTQLGAKTFLINHKPNGININHDCGSLAPEQLQDAVKKYQADAGFAFDGDGDRITAVNKCGDVKNGDDILALLLGHPLYKEAKKIVGTIMTNHGFVRFLEKNKSELIRTPVGDKYITSQLIKENLLLGGEQSGHIIMRDYLGMGDGIFTALRILESMQHNNNGDMKSFIHYPQILLNIPVRYKKDLESSTIQQIIQESIDTLVSGRVIVRYSGTENMLRIMVEDEDGEHAQRVGEKLSASLQKELAQG